MLKYNPQKIEKKWQKYWLQKKTYEPDLKNPKGKGKFYNLMMFPYSSAEGLHVGNMYAFVGSDIYGRYQRMKGRDVFEPIGLDGFGIHSENFALKTGKHPIEHARASEKNFYRQLQMIGNSFAWNEKLETYDPDYYKWTQWIFIQMFKKGLAYRKKAMVNWCPSCLTVLADEQVISSECERCDTKVVKKELEQWFFRITDYAEKLLSNIPKLDWSERVKTAQTNWIGKSEGALLKFPIAYWSDQYSTGQTSIVKVFTTRPDTLFGATYLVLSPEHELLEKLKREIKNWGKVSAYVQNAIQKSEVDRITEGREKTGIRLEGVNAINPATKKEISVWVADYVLGGYGTGAIMAVPAHDERDFEFAKKFNLLIRTVICLTSKASIKFINRSLISNWREVVSNNYTYSTTHEYVEFLISHEEINRFIPVGQSLLKEGPYYFSIRGKSKFVVYKYKVFDIFQPGQDVEAKSYGREKKIPESELNWSTVYVETGILINSGKFNRMDSEKAKWEITKEVGGERRVQYHLRDWLISRQRYWGPPIPMIYCEKCASAGGSAQAGWQPVPEDELPVLLPKVKNFRPTGTNQSPLASVGKFYKTKCPVCKGEARRETDVSDTFLDSAWYYLRYSSVKDKSNPWNSELTKKWLPVDMYIGGAEHSVLHLLYARFLAMVFNDLGRVGFEEPFSKFRAHGLLIKDGAKMSKSRGNVVNPDEYIKKYGADALRMYLMFLGPFEQGGDFRDTGISGITRFLSRVWNFTSKLEEPKKTDEKADRTINKYVKETEDDIQNLKFNTGVSGLMKLLNELEDERLTKKQYETFLKLLAPFAPHVVEELWAEVLGNKNSIHLESWPEYDETLLAEETVAVVIQINGKLRDIVQVRKGLVENEIREIVLGRIKVKNRLESKKIKKFVYIQDKLTNIVV